jgi:hypothetical protein
VAGLLDALGFVGKAYDEASKTPGLSLVTLPTEILRDPTQFTGPDGHLDIGALLSPGRREYLKKERQAVEDARKIDTLSNIVGAGKDIASLFSSAPTPEAQDALRSGFQGMGADPAMLEPFNFAAQNSRDVARRAAAASGASPELTNIADIDLAGKLGATEFSAGQTRETQRRAFGQRKQLQDERLQAQREAQTRRLAASQNAPGGIPSTGAERRDQKNVEALRQALAANAIPEASIPLAQSAVDAGSGSLALQVLTQSGYAAGRRDSSRVLQDKGFVEARNRANNAAKTLETMRSVQQVASTPDGAGIDPSLFSPAMALTLPEDADRLSVALSVMNPDFAQRKQALMSTAGKASQQYILDMTGKVSNVNELNRIRNVAPNGNEASGALFVSKMRAFNSALQREQQTAEREAQAIAEAIRNGDWKGTLPGGIAAGLQAERDASLRQLADDLSSATTNPDLHSDAPLTEAERQDLEKYGYGK